MKRYTRFLCFLTILCLRAAAPAQGDPAGHPLVTIGEDVITQEQVLHLLEQQYGPVVLTKLVYGVLVRQAAEKAGVMPTAEDVEERLAAIRRRSPQALSAAASDPAKMQQIKSDLLLDIALENLRLLNVKVDDSEVASYYALHQSEFQLPVQVQTVLVISQREADSQTAERLLKAGGSPESVAAHTGLQVNGVQGFQFDLDALPAVSRQKIGQTVLGMKAGEIKTLMVDKYYLTFQAKKSTAASVPTLAEIRAQAARAAGLAKAPGADKVLGSLYKAAHPIFTDQRLEAYFTTQNALVKP